MPAPTVVSRPMGPLNHGLKPSDCDWRAVKALKDLAGFIFVCSDSNAPDHGISDIDLSRYFENSVGIPSIRKGMPLFLFDNLNHHLYGVFEAASSCGDNLDPRAQEGNDQWRSTSSMNLKYPTRVKFQIRAKRPALKEESFLHILDHVEVQHLRLYGLQLTPLKVQKLLVLFDAAEAAKTKCKAERKRGKQKFQSIKDQGAIPLCRTSKSKSDSYHDCSSISLNSYKDEWTDDGPSENIYHENCGGICARRSQINLGIFQPNQKYNSGMYAATYYSEKMMHLRLKETDPAVSSSSFLCEQTGIDQSDPLLSQNNALTMSLMSLSQMQLPFTCSDKLALPSMPPKQNTAYLSQSKRWKWSEQKKNKKRSSNSKKQGIHQEGQQNTKDVWHQVQHSESVDNAAICCQMQMIQLSQMFGKIQQDSTKCAHLPSIVADQNPEVLTFPQVHTGVAVEQNGGGFDFFESLHLEILQFVRWTRPSSKMQLHVETAIECVRKGVKSVWSEADVEVYGSFATGLCLQHSDVDLAVMDAPCLPSMQDMSIAQASACLIRELSEALRNCDWCESINSLDTASMPVLKCFWQPFGSSVSSSSMAPTIAVDITIGSICNSYLNENSTAQVFDPAECRAVPGKPRTRHTGGAAREYVLHKLQELPALSPLVLLLKSFLHHMNLNNVYSGGLGSFALTLLVAFYLEQVTSFPAYSFMDLSKEFYGPSPIMGMVDRKAGIDSSSCSSSELYVKQAADIIQSVLSFWDKERSCILGVLLLDFLQMFGFERDLSCEKLVLKGMDGSPGGIFKREDRHVALWIDDPLRRGVNIGGGSFGMVHVQAAFRELFQCLTGCHGFISSLQCDEKDCRDLAALRQLSNVSNLT
ncbi:hypothetical protein KP509_20G045600 [Ceratopteris richardii]|uniref:DCD domain-containing protein n=1 Tax=Ceratopteris richardii TaxID=49495 RepID=A0A8T2SFK1_CERRI|nr:hypothetical protein KP509_20G045600 [Ceratopteris richardii]